MIGDFNLDLEVIADFSKPYTFQRPIITINNVGQEEETYTPYNETVHLRKNSMKETNNINEQGYNYESTIRITAQRDSDIQANDVVEYRDREYRILDTDYKETGTYTNFIGGYTKEETQ